MDLVTPSIIFFLMISSWLWGKSQGYKEGTAHGAMALFWWFEDKAGVREVERWIDREPDLSLRDSLSKIHKYRDSDKVIALIISRGEEDE